MSGPLEQTGYEDHEEVTREVLPRTWRQDQWLNIAICFESARYGMRTWRQRPQSILQLVSLLPCFILLYLGTCYYAGRVGLLTFLIQYLVLTISTFFAFSVAVNRLKRTPLRVVRQGVVKDGRPWNGSYHAVNGAWVCSCGATVEDEFLEGVAGTVNSAMMDLSARVRARVSERAATRGTEGRLQSLIRHALRSLGYTKTTLPPPREGRDDGPQSIAMDETHPQRSGRPMILFLCVTTSRAYSVTKKTDINIGWHDDEALFGRMKCEFNSVVGLWRRVLALRRLKDIRFVKFRLAPRVPIDILVHSGMEQRILESFPSIFEPDYLYDPRPVEFWPPVGHNTMKHMYYRSKDCVDVSYCRDRFPKHTTGDVTIDTTRGEAYAWGIDLTEERAWWLLGIAGLVIIVASLVTGVAWACSKKDVQGGLAIAAYMPTTLACLYATLQVVLDYN